MKRHIRSTYLVLLCSCIMGSATVSASDDGLVLVRDGKPMATIVHARPVREPKADMPSGAEEYRYTSCALQQAARDLQTYVFKMTGAMLPVVDDTESVEGARILVGASRYTRDIGLSNDSFERQEYLIRSDDDTLVLMGRDETYQQWILNTHNAVQAMSGGLSPLEIYQAIGTHYAVNDFLERFGGIRWYFAGPIGEVVPQRKDLIVPKVDIRRRPAVRFRAVRPALMPPKLHYERRLDNRAPGQRFPDYRREDQPHKEAVSHWGRRLKLGGDTFRCNHSLQVLDRFRDKHPEWWPTRSTWPCLSDQQVVQAMIQEGRDSFDPRRPFGGFFPVVPHDNDSWCTCDRCKTQREGEQWSDHLNSNYVWGYIAKVAEQIKQTHPDKIITCVAYRTYSLAPDPEKVTLPDNVAVQICPGFSAWLNPEPSTPAYHEKWFTDWAKVVNPDNVYLWWYWLWPTSSGYTSFPVVSPYEVGAMVRAMKRFGFRGGVSVQIDGNPGAGHYWSYPVLDHLRVYVLAKMLDDWDLDEREIVDEYYRLFYGPAEAPMKEFWEFIHRAPYDRHPGVTHPERYEKWRREEEPKPGDWDWRYVCPPEDLKQLGRWLDEARSLTTEMSIYRERVNLIDKAVYQAYLVRASKEVLGAGKP